MKTQKMNTTISPFGAVLLAVSLTAGFAGVFQSIADRKSVV